jgi:hypothetical protein
MAGPVTATPIDYYVWNDRGGTWADAEKSSTNTEDDYMCWAAAASNILAWTGWGKAGGTTNADQIFQYFQDHWTDQGGAAGFGWQWWFTGNNPSQGQPGWSQVDVPGGGFYPSLNFYDYYHQTTSFSGALATIDQYLHASYGTTLVVNYSSAHVITCWGFQYDSSSPNYYTGVWLTDSDDDKNGSSSRPDVLRYYDVKYISGIWFLQNYYGTNNWYIESVQGLQHNPEPATIALLTLGAFAFLKRKREKC